MKLTTEMSYLKTLDQQYKIENPGSNQSTKKNLKNSQDVKFKSNSSKVFQDVPPNKLTLEVNQRYQGP